MENAKFATSRSVSFANNDVVKIAHRIKRILIAYMVKFTLISYYIKNFLADIEFR